MSEPYAPDKFPPLDPSTQELLASAKRMIELDPTGAEGVLAFVYRIGRLDGLLYEAKPDHIDHALKVWR
jgi:hypothetical protein